MIYPVKYAQAVLELVPNAIFSTSGNDADTIQIVEWDSENPTQPTDAAIKAKITELETAEANAATQKETDAANGNQKLLDLGLTQAEATALTGYTPPAE